MQGTNRDPIQYNSCIQCCRCSGNGQLGDGDTGWQEVGRQPKGQRQWEGQAGEDYSKGGSPLPYQSWEGPSLEWLRSGWSSHDNLLNNGNGDNQDCNQ